MTEIQNKPIYNLEARCLAYAQRVRNFIRKLPHSTAAVEDRRQLIRSSGSVGANYIEANEALSKKDFVMRVKISRKEAKESHFWLQLLTIQGNELEEERQALSQETIELKKILSAIIQKSL